MASKDDMAEDRTEWAEDRTDWAEDRTVLANERTFAGWMRTGMAAVAVAIGLKAVFGAFEPTWAAKAVATLFIFAALYIFYAAARQARQTQARLDAHDATAQPERRLSLLAAILAAGSVMTGAILWYL